MHLHRFVATLYRFPRLKRSIYTASIAVAIISFAGAITGAIFPLYLKQFSDNIFLLGLIGAITPILASLSTIIIGEASDYYNKKRLMILGILGTSIVMAGYYFANSIFVLVLLAVAVSLTREMIYTPYTSLLRVMSPPRNASGTFSVSMLFTTIPVMVGPVVAGYIALEIFRLPFVIGAILVLSASLLASTIKEPRIRQSSQFSLGKKLFSKLWKDFKSWDKRVKYLAFVAFSLYVWYSAKWFMGPLLLDYLGFGTEMIGWWLTISLIPFVLFSLPIGRIHDKRKIVATMIAGLAVSALAVLILGFSTGIHLFILVTMIAAGNVLTEILLEAKLTSMSPRNQSGEVTGTFNAIRNMGDISGKVVPTAIAQFLGIGFAFVPLFFLFIASIWLLSKIE